MDLESFSNCAEPSMTGWQVFLWWERRRILYNGLLLIIGIASIFAMEWCFDRFLPPGEDGIEPMALWAVVLMYGIVANICYTSGWVVELIGRRTGVVRARERAEKLYFVGFWVSGLLTTAPLWFGLICWFVYRSH